MQNTKNNLNSSAILIAILLALPNTSYAAGVDVILLLPASWLIALVLAIISIKISTNKSIIVYLHLGSAAFYMFIRFSGLFGLAEGSTGTIIWFSFLILYPLISSCLILILSRRWRLMGKNRR